eukprot:GHRR01017232.1.p2 GENE.GHRR01017232.1~~GHRR01017232.1.p2  ORF type:complete len:157 (-),score=37.02 GHRR01017232.1:637-1107(-)
MPLYGNRHSATARLQLYVAVICAYYHRCEPVVCSVCIWLLYDACPRLSQVIPGYQLLDGQQQHQAHIGTCYCHAHCCSSMPPPSLALLAASRHMPQQGIVAEHQQVAQQHILWLGHQDVRIRKAVAAARNMQGKLRRPAWAEQRGQLAGSVKHTTL